MALGHNPLCGDRLRLYVRLDGDRIADVAFQGSGCAISKASASLMTDAIKGKTLEEAEALYGKFHDLLTGPPDVKATGAGLGKLAVFSGVREFPARVKCATLAWHTLHSALAGAAPRPPRSKPCPPRCLNPRPPLPKPTSSRRSSGR
jgi:nitrogen fixation NifU-like protein